MKRKSSLHAVFTALISICLLCLGFSAKADAASRPKSYSLVVSGAGFGQGDGNAMEQVLEKNKMFSQNIVYRFTYDTEANTHGIRGTNRIVYSKAIDQAYSKCTSRDTAFFFHSGHGMEGFTKGLGIVLSTTKIGEVSTWYPYKDLLNKLSKVPCKHMVIIIQACESGAVEKAYYKLPESKRKKISVFWSSAANQLGYAYTTGISVYGKTALRALGYYGTLYGDRNNDGNVTVAELGRSISSYIDTVSDSYNAPHQTPGYASSGNLNTVIYTLDSPGLRYTRLNKNSAVLYTKGRKTVRLRANVKGASKKVTWYSSNKAVATVSSSGLVTAKGPGTAKIMAKANGVGDWCTIKVKKVSIRLNKQKATLYVNGTKTVKLKATITGPSKKVTWKSSNRRVASVSSSGKVTAHKTGSAKITASANGVSASCRISVKRKKSGSTKDISYLCGKKSSVLTNKISGLTYTNHTDSRQYSLSDGSLWFDVNYDSDRVQVVGVRDNARGYSIHGLKVGMTTSELESAVKKNGMECYSGVNGPIMAVGGIVYADFYNGRCDSLVLLYTGYSTIRETELFLNGQEEINYWPTVRDHLEYEILFE